MTVLTLTLDPDAEPDPLYLLEVLEALAEAAWVANRQTMHHAALGDISDAYSAVGYVKTAVERLPQLAAQIMARLSAEPAIPVAGLAAIQDALGRTILQLEGAAGGLAEAHAAISRLDGAS
jgi:hypothetical protein